MLSYQPNPSISLAFHSTEQAKADPPVPPSVFGNDEAFTLSELLLSLMESAPVDNVDASSRPREASLWFPSDRHSATFFEYVGFDDEFAYRTWVTQIAVIRLLLRAFDIRVRVNTLDTQMMRLLVRERLGYDAPGVSPEAARIRAEVLLDHRGVPPFGLDLIELELAIPPDEDCISTHAWSFVLGSDATMPSLEHVNDRVTDARRRIYRSFAQGLRRAIDRQFGEDAILTVRAEQMLQQPASDLETAIGRWLFRFLFVTPDSVQIICSEDPDTL